MASSIASASLTTTSRPASFFTTPYAALVSPRAVKPPLASTSQPGVATETITVESLSALAAPAPHSPSLEHRWMETTYPRPRRGPADRPVGLPGRRPGWRRTRTRSSPRTAACGGRCAGRTSCSSSGSLPGRPLHRDHLGNRSEVASRLPALRRFRWARAKRARHGRRAGRATDAPLGDHGSREGCAAASQRCLRSPSASRIRSNLPCASPCVVRVMPANRRAWTRFSRSSTLTTRSVYSSA